MVLREGISTRIRMMTMAIATGYAQAVWLRDTYCSASPAQIFPGGVEGLELLEFAGPPFPRLRTTRDRPDLTAAWDRVWSALRLPAVRAVPHGVLFRGHHPRAVPFGFFAATLETLAGSTTGQVAVLADSRRREITDILGSRVIPQLSREMQHDMDRDSAQTLRYLRDWSRFLAAETVTSNCVASNAMWPVSIRPKTALRSAHCPVGKW